MKDIHIGAHINTHSFVFTNPIAKYRDSVPKATWCLKQHGSLYLPVKKYKCGSQLNDTVGFSSETANLPSDIFGFISLGKLCHLKGITKKHQEHCLIHKDE